MPKFDESDNPIRGFQLISYPEGLYLRCRGRALKGQRDCEFYRRIRRTMYLEEVMRLAAAHRVECDLRVQAPSSISDLPFEIVPRGRRFAPVEELYHRWVEAGGPPLGTSISRWWDQRLIELGRLIRKD